MTTLVGAPLRRGSGQQHGYVPQNYNAPQGNGTTTGRERKGNVKAAGRTTSVFACGQNERTQLGLGPKSNPKELVSLPQLVEPIDGTKVIQLACGTTHSAALLENGELYTWGNSTDGRLGQSAGSKGITPYLPSKVTSLSGKGIISVSCGDYHSLALDKDGRVYVWGYGDCGQLGLGSGSDTHLTETPVLVKGLLQNIRIAAVACGPYHSAAISGDGKLFTWGSGYYGLLGHGDEKVQESPAIVEALSNQKVVQVACGNSHTLALTDNGEVHSFGDGKNGQLGVADIQLKAKPERQSSIPVKVEGLDGSRIVEVAAGGLFNLARTQDGRLFSWGMGEDGQLGRSLDVEGDVVAWTPGLVEALVGAGQVVSIGCGWAQAFALTAIGDLYTWGNGNTGALGHGQTKPERKPRVVWAFYTHEVRMAAMGGWHTLFLSDYSPLVAATASATSSAVKREESAIESQSEDGRGIGVAAAERLLRGDPKDLQAELEALRAKMLKREEAGLWKQTDYFDGVMRTFQQRVVEDADRLKEAVSETESTTKEYLEYKDKANNELHRLKRIIDQQAADLYNAMDAKVFAEKQAATLPKVHQVYESTVKELDEVRAFHAKEMAEMQEKYDDMKEKFDAHEETVRLLEEKLRGDHAEEFKKSKTEARDQYADLSAAYEADKAEWEAERKSLIRLIQTAELEETETRKTCETKIQALTDSLECEEKVNAQLKTSKDALDEENVALKSQLAAFEKTKQEVSDMKLLLSNSTKHSGDVDRLKVQLEEELRRVKVASNLEIEEYKRSADEDKRRKEEIEKEHEELMEQVRCEKDRASGLEEEKNKLSEEIMTLRVSLEEETLERRLLEKKYENAKDAQNNETKMRSQLQETRTSLLEEMAQQREELLREKETEISLLKKEFESEVELARKSARARLEEHQEYSEKSRAVVEMQRETLESEVQRAQAEIKRLEEDVEEGKSELHDLYHSKERLEEEKEELLGQHIRDEETITSLERQIQQLRDSEIEARKELSESLDRVKERDREIEELNVRISELKFEVSEVEGREEYLGESVDALRAEHQAQMERMESEKEKLQNALDEVRGECRDLKSAEEMAREESERRAQSEMAAAMKKAEDKETEMEETISGLREVVSSLQTEVSTIEQKKRGEFEKALFEKEERIHQLEHDLEVMTDRKREEVKRLQEFVDEEVRRAKDENNETESELVEKLEIERKEKRDLWMRVNEMEEDLKAKESDHDESSQRLASKLLEAESKLDRTERELLETKSSLESQLSDATTEGLVLKKEVADLKNKVDSEAKYRERLQDSEMHYFNVVEELQAKLQAKEEEADSTQKSLEEARGDIVSLEEKISGLEEEKKAVETEVDTMKESIESKDTKIADLEQQVVQLDGKVDDALALIDDRAEEYSAELEKSKKSREDEVGDLTEQIEALKKLVADRDESLVRDMSEMESATKGIEQQLRDQLQEQNEKMISDQLEHQKNMKKLTDEMIALTDKFEESSAEVKRLQSETTRLDSERNAARDEADMANREKEKLLENEGRNEEALLAAGESIEKLEGDMEASKKVEEELRAEIATLSEQLKEAENRVEEIDRDISSKAKEEGLQREKLSSYHREREAKLEKELKSLKEELKFHHETVDDDKNELTRVNNELVSTMNELSAENNALNEEVERLERRLKEEKKNAKAALAASAAAPAQLSPSTRVVKFDDEVQKPSVETGGDSSKVVLLLRGENLALKEDLAQVREELESLKTAEGENSSTKIQIPSASMRSAQAEVAAAELVAMEEECDMLRKKMELLEEKMENEANEKKELYQKIATLKLEKGGGTVVSENVSVPESDADDDGIIMSRSELEKTIKLLRRQLEDNNMTPLDKNGGPNKGPTQLAQQSKEWEEKYDALEAEKDKVEERVLKLELNLDERDDQLRAVLEELDEARSDAEGLSEHVSELKKKHKKASNELKNERESSSQLRKQVWKMEQELEQLRNRIAELEEAQEAHGDEDSTAMKDEIEALKLELENERAMRLEMEHGRQQDDVDVMSLVREAEARREDAEIRKDALSKDLFKARKEIMRLKARLGDDPRNVDDEDDQEDSHQSQLNNSMGSENDNAESSDDDGNDNGGGVGFRRTNPKPVLKRDNSPKRAPRNVTWGENETSDDPRRKPNKPPEGGGKPVGTIQDLDSDEDMVYDVGDNMYDTDASDAMPTAQNQTKGKINPRDMPPLMADDDDDSNEEDFTDDTMTDDGMPKLEGGKDMSMESIGERIKAREEAAKRKKEKKKELLEKAKMETMLAVASGEVDDERTEEALMRKTLAQLQENESSITDMTLSDDSDNDDDLVANSSLISNRKALSGDELMLAKVTESSLYGEATNAEYLNRGATKSEDVDPMRRKHLELAEELRNSIKNEVSDDEEEEEEEVEEESDDDEDDDDYSEEKIRKRRLKMQEEKRKERERLAKNAKKLKNAGDDEASELESLDSVDRREMQEAQRKMRKQEDLDRAEEKNLNRLELLLQGDNLVKFDLGKNMFGAEVHRLKRFTLADDSRVPILRWGPPNKAYNRVLVLREVTWVEYGPRSEVFRRQIDRIEAPWLCFSLHTANRTLDLMARSDGQLELWFMGLQYLVMERQHMKTHGWLLWTRLKLKLDYYAGLRGLKRSDLVVEAIRHAAAGKRGSVLKVDGPGVERRMVSASRKPSSPKAGAAAISAVTVKTIATMKSVFGRKRSTSASKSPIGRP